MRPMSLKVLRVGALPARRTLGFLVAGGLRLPVALGRSGIKVDKREGDGATPRGRFRLVRVWWRADRDRRPRTLLPVRRISPVDTWCEDPSDRRYNRAVQVEPGNGGDRLWREDALYDVLIEIDHNSRPRIAGRGSAIFIHVARPGLRPTAGCVALAKPLLRRLLARMGPKTRIEIH
jgi:L,D-peptidoglycan transpeptidase YkuD (ErfK/YbiS/YcfS/YnhG family)